MLRHMWLLIVFLTLGTHGLYRPAEWTVIAVEHGQVTLVLEDRTQTIESDEAWQVGNKAACIISKDGQIMTDFVYVR